MKSDEPRKPAKQDDWTPVSRKRGNKPKAAPPSPVAPRGATVVPRAGPPGAARREPVTPVGGRPLPPGSGQVGRAAAAPALPAAQVRAAVAEPQVPPASAPAAVAGAPPAVAPPAAPAVAPPALAPFSMGMLGGKDLSFPEKHVKGNPVPRRRKGNKAQVTTQASRGVMDHARQKILAGDASLVDDQASGGTDMKVSVPRQHRHRAASKQTRTFLIHKGGGDGRSLDFFMQHGEPSDSEASGEE